MEAAVLIVQVLMVFATLYLAYETSRMVRAAEQSLKVMREDFVAERHPRIVVGGLFTEEGNGSIWLMNYSKKEIGVFKFIDLICKDCAASPWEAIDIFSLDEEQWLVVKPGDFEILDVEFKKLPEVLEIRKHLAIRFSVLYPDYPCSPLDCYASFKEDLTLTNVECIPHIRGQESPVLTFEFAKLPEDCEQSGQ